MHNTVCGFGSNPHSTVLVLNAPVHDKLMPLVDFVDVSQIGSDDRAAFVYYKITLGVRR